MPSIALRQVVGSQFIEANDGATVGATNAQRSAVATTSAADVVDPNTHESVNEFQPHPLQRGETEPQRAAQGITEHASVGEAVGAPLGRWVGSDVVGDTVGPRVVGARVGREVGAGVGLAVGDAVGPDVLGASVGANVGAVGDSVGSDVIGAGGLTVFLVNTVRFRPLGSFGWPPVLNMPPVGTATAGKFTPTVDEELPRAATSPRAS